MISRSEKSSDLDWSSSAIVMGAGPHIWLVPFLNSDFIVTLPINEDLMVSSRHATFVLPLTASLRTIHRLSTSMTVDLVSEWVSLRGAKADEGTFLKK
jgi:hypothetical protein